VGYLLVLILEVYGEAMTLQEFCDVAQLEIEVYYSPCSAGPWISHLRKPYGSIDFKESSSDIMLRTQSGWGKTPTAALSALVINLNTSSCTLAVIQNAKGERNIIGLPKFEWSTS
jgi:hypothetical protein